MKKIKVVALLAIVASLASCGQKPAPSSSQFSKSSETTTSLPESISSETPISSSEEISSSEPIVSSSEIISSSSPTPVSSSSSIEEKNLALEFFKNPNFGKPDEMKTLPAYTPTRFVKDSFKTDSTRSLGTGVDHVVYSFNLNSGKHVIANAIEVDTTKATLRAANAKTIATVNTQINDFETAHPNIKVMAGVNADFFATGSGGSSVNAYVKDKVIVKAGHNDNGVYDYKDERSDIPASMPMLLGVSGTNTRIGPIVNNKTVKETIQSKFSYGLYASTGKALPERLTGQFVSNKMRLNDADFNLIDNGARFTADATGNLSVKIKLNVDSASCFTYGSVKAVKVLEEGEKVTTAPDMDKGYVYLFTKDNKAHDFQVGDYVGYTLSNDDQTWEGYTTVIGGRQSLVEKGNIAPTVTLENTNGAQRTDIPRTCAGITSKGKVIIITIEALRYGGKSTSTSDSYGVNLPELAEVMRYLGCYNALNFDGGGSTQLVTSNNNGLGNKELKVRSSDYGTYNLESCRKVYSTLLVTTK